MTLVFIRWNRLYRLIVVVGFLIFYNEILVYYLSMLGCQWPLLETDENTYENDEFLKVMVLSDVHLLGSREGHWLDKLRREWQIERSFQSFMLIHEPNVVFILGDIFDEGKWCSDSEFQNYVTRFRKMFSVPHKTSLYVLAGNHDIGFHYMVDEHKRMRFDKHLNTSPVEQVVLKNNVFVLINSMALEEDRCKMCYEAEEKLNRIYKKLSCCRDPSCGNQQFCPSPILLSHFPLFRQNDQECMGADSAPEDEKKVLFKEKFDCLGKHVSKELLDNLQPRLVLTGHTHHFCITNHTFKSIYNPFFKKSKRSNLQENRVIEWTVPSFSWRNKNNPSFLMISLDNTNHKVHKCFLPRESTVIATYVIIIIVLLFYHISFLSFCKKSL